METNSNKTQIRSIGSVRVFTKENFQDALSCIISSLYFSLDNYSEFYVKNIILTYNVCYEDSVLNSVKLYNENFNQLSEVYSKSNMIDNKNALRIDEKKLPLTTELTKWGDIKIIKGSYPHKFNYKETRLLISSGNKDNILERFNCVITIRGLEIKGKKIIIHSVNVTDKTFKLIHLKFIDIIYDSNVPNSFVRIIDNNQYVYDKGIKVLSQKRKKAKYFTNLSICKA